MQAGNRIFELTYGNISNVLMVILHVVTHSTIKINVALTKEMSPRFEFVVFLMFRSYLLEEACTRNLVSLEKPMRTFPC